MILQSSGIITHYIDLPLVRAYHSERPPFRRDPIRNRSKNGCGAGLQRGCREGFST